MRNTKKGTRKRALFLFSAYPFLSMELASSENYRVCSQTLQYRDLFRVAHWRLPCPNRL